MNSSEKKIKKNPIPNSNRKYDIIINLTKELKYLCTENDKRLKEEIKENRAKWKDIYTHEM
jgi:hypothetical protein